MERVIQRSREKILFDAGSPEYFKEIDRRFLAVAKQFMPWKDRPFETLIDYQALAHQDVLEIGTGQGTHAQLIAPCARSFTGIDLTDAAVQMTRQRLNLIKTGARILQMDAEKMAFPDKCFDWIWTWDVIHHSANTSNVI